MAFTDLMIDLETLGKRSNSAVVAVGAVFFDPNTGELGETFNGAIEISDAMRFGKVDGDTLKWWLTQSDAARKQLVRGRHTAAEVWGDFYKFALKHGNKICPWGNGASFDISMCDWQFGAVLGKNAPWDFWNVQDCRTIKRVANGIVTYSDKLEGTAHTALDDAIHQAKYVTAYWRGLRRIETLAATVAYIPQPSPTSNDDEEDFDLDLG